MVTRSVRMNRWTNEQTRWTDSPRT